jgi:hypothetical protein
MSIEAIKRKVGIGATASSATLIVSGSVQVGGTGSGSCSSLAGYTRVG